ncbi:MAG: tetratricopeptide repeat protein [Promethearchaeota archaeon]
MAQITPLTLDDLQRVGLIDRKTLRTWKTTLEEHLHNSETMQLRNEESNSLVEEGLGYLANNSPRDAVTIFLRAISLYPDNVYAWQLMGDALESSDNAKKAFEVYNRISQKKPDYAQILSSMGIMYFKRKRYKQAIREFKHSIDIDSNQFVTWDNLGVVYSEQGKYRDADKAFRKAIELAPASVSTWFNFGSMKLKTKQYQEAGEIFDQCIKLEPRNGEAWKNLALALFKIKDFVMARQACKKGLEFLPNDENLLSLDKSISRKLKL